AAGAVEQRHPEADDPQAGGGPGDQVPLELGDVRNLEHAGGRERLGLSIDLHGADLGSASRTSYAVARAGDGRLPDDPGHDDLPAAEVEALDAAALVARGPGSGLGSSIGGRRTTHDRLAAEVQVRQGLATDLAVRALAWHDGQRVGPAGRRPV